MGTMGLLLGGFHPDHQLPFSIWNEDILIIIREWFQVGITCLHPSRSHPTGPAVEFVRDDRSTVC